MRGPDLLAHPEDSAVHRRRGDQLPSGPSAHYDWRCAIAAIDTLLTQFERKFAPWVDPDDGVTRYPASAMFARDEFLPIVEQARAELSALLAAAPSATTTVNVGLPSGIAEGDRLIGPPPIGVREYRGGQWVSEASDE